MIKIKRASMEEILESKRLWMNSDKITREKYFYTEIFTNKLLLFYVLFSNWFNFRNGKYKFYVAKEYDHILGFAYSTNKGTFSSTGVLVLNGYRGKGIAKKLIIELLKDTPLIEVNIEESNTPAIELYKRCGFRIVRTSVNMKIGEFNYF